MAYDDEDLFDDEDNFAYNDEDEYESYEKKQYNYDEDDYTKVLIKKN